MTITPLSPPIFRVSVPVTNPTVTQYSARFRNGETSTVYFNQPAVVVEDAFGDPCIIAAPGLKIIDATPRSGLVDGFIAHGMMINPFQIGSTGFDSYVGTAPEIVTNPSSAAKQVPYNGTLNVHPTVSGDLDCSTPKTIVHGLTRRNGSILSMTNMFDKYVAWTVLESVPPAGFIRPGVSSIDKIVTKNISDFRSNVFRSITPPSTAVTLSQAKLNMIDRWVQPNWGFRSGVELDNGEKARTHQIDRVGDYAGEQGPARALDLVAMHGLETWAEKLPLAGFIAHQCADVISYQERGGRFGYGAGQQGGKALYAMYGAFLYGDEDYLNKFLTLGSCFKDQPIRVDDYVLGMVTEREPSTSSSNYRKPYLIQDLGEADWSISGSFVDYNATMPSRYRTTTTGMCLMETLAACLLVNGPTGQNGGDFLASNGYSQTVEYMDKVAQMLPINYPPHSYMKGVHIDWYNATRSIFTPAVIPRKPTELIPSRGHIVSAANGVTVDFKNADYSDPAPTNKKFGYSIDGRAFTVVNGLVNLQTLTGSYMIGMLHYGRVGQDNSVGAGRWTSTDKDSAGSTIRAGEFTPSGTPSTAAMTVARAASVVFRPAPNYHGPIFEPCPTPVPQEVSRLYPALPYMFGGKNPVKAVWQWQRNTGSWVDVVDYSGEVLAANFGDWTWGAIPLDPTRPGDHRCKLTMYDADGGTLVVYTNTVTVPTMTLKQSILYPETDGTTGIKHFTRRWGNAHGFTFSGASLYQQINVSGASNASTIVNLFASLDYMPVLGSIPSVPEGDLVLLSHDFPYTAGNNNTQMGFVIRASGDSDATATGYFCSVILNAGNVMTFQVRKITAGALGTAVQSSSIPTISRFGLSYFRVNWKETAGVLTIKFKAWNQRGDFQDKSVEPDWMWTTTDATPHPAGRVGYGFPSTRDGRGIITIGLSTDAAVPAPIRALKPVYTPS